MLLHCCSTCIHVIICCVGIRGFCKKSFNWGLGSDLCRNHCICGVRKTLPCLLLPCQWHHTPFLLTVSLGLLGSNDLLFSHPCRLINWPCVWTNAGIEELFHSSGTILTSIVTSWVGVPDHHILLRTVNIVIAC